MQILRKHRQGKASSWVMLFLLVTGLYVGYQFFTPFWVSLEMRKIAKDAALTYRLTGDQSQAEYKITSGMKKEHIPVYIQDRPCQFWKGASDFKVTCSWVAPIYLEVPGWRSFEFRKAYDVQVSVDNEGVVEEY